MDRVARVLEDPIGYRAKVVEDGSGTGGRVARIECEAPAGTHGGRLHVHAYQEERFAVSHGAITIRRGLRGAERVEAGQTTRVPAGTVHTFRADTDSRFTAELRPALRVVDFFDELFEASSRPSGEPSLRDAARLVRRYPREFLYFPFVPPRVQRVLGALIAAGPLARRR